MTDTEMTLETRHPRRSPVPRRPCIVPPCFRLRVLLVGSLLALGTTVGHASVVRWPLEARVAWVRGGRAYIASHDSLYLAPYSLLNFAWKGKTVATGEVERMVDGGMAIARLTAGSLAAVKDLDRLRVFAERPGGPPVLRVGIPSQRRSTLFFACDQIRIEPPAGPRTFRVEGDSSGYRLLPSPDLFYEVGWPESLRVRPFDDAADQEIALERGEIDVGVFWPGELSTHMREHPRWKDHLSSWRKRGDIGAIWLGLGPTESRCATALREARTFEALNQNLFRGDLRVPWDVTASCGDTTPRGPTVPVRYEVDTRSPGKLVLERFLNRDLPPSRATGDLPVVHLFYLDSRADVGDEAVLAAAEYIRRGPFPHALRARADRLLTTSQRRDSADGSRDPWWFHQAARDSLGLTFPLTIECQVVCDPRLLPYVSNLGASRFVDLFDCVGPERRP